MRFTYALWCFLVCITSFSRVSCEEASNVTLEAIAAVDGGQETVAALATPLDTVSDLPDVTEEAFNASYVVHDAADMVLDATDVILADSEESLKSLDPSDSLDGLNLGGLLSGGNTDFLLDQLDAATAELTALKEEKEKLTATVSEKETENNGLRAQVVRLTTQLSELGSMISSLNITLTALENDRAGSNALSKEQQEKHEEELQALQEKIHIAERNATLFENRAHFARNEKAIIKLSQENCLLELEATRHTQLDEVDALRAELNALKKTKAQTCAAGPTGTQAQKAGSMSAAAPTTTPSAAASGCDSAKCFDHFVSKYLFFWADEHRSTSASASKSKPDAPHMQPSTTEGGSARRERDTAASPGVLNEALNSEILRQSASYLRAAYTWCASTYMRYAHPYVWKLLLIEAKIASTALSIAVRLVSSTWSEVLSPLLFNVLAPAGRDLYSTQVLPFVTANIYPWYKANLEMQVNSTYTGVVTAWERDYEAWFDHNVMDAADFVIGRLHYASYFTVRFLGSEDLLGDLQEALVYMQGFVPSVIEQFAALPALQSQLGEHAQLVVTTLVYTCVGLFAYMVRRVLLGIVSLLLIAVLSPLLVVVYCLAKLAKPFLPKKKSAKKATARQGKSALPGTAPTAGTAQPLRAGPGSSGVSGGGGGGLAAPPISSAPTLAYGNLRAAQTRSQGDGGRTTGGRAGPMFSISNNSSHESPVNDGTPPSSQEWNAYEP